MNARPASHNESPAPTGPAPAHCPPPDGPETTAFRERLARAGRSVSSLASDLAFRDPDAWGRGAYLALLGRVFTLLMDGGEELPLKDLTALSKIIAEQRRAETQAALAARKTSGLPGSPGRADSRGASPAALPDELRRVVAHLYGLDPETDGDA